MGASSLSALPTDPTVIHGEADLCQSDSAHLMITASDRTILNYQSFNVGQGESVQFIQPNAKSTVLNRVVGGDPSQILGKLNANGRLFLVNPHGIYIGPSGSVNVGSFIASTLSIKDEDFANGSYRFFSESGEGTIVNEGTISAGLDGGVALLSSMIQNRGSIVAKADRIVLAAGERVALDFTGDGLMQFSVDGELEKALIENYGDIEAADGSVELSVRAARQAVKMVLNTDGIETASGIEKQGGEIRLVSGSHIAAKNVCVDGDGNVEVSGCIEGKTVHVLGDYVDLQGAAIDASGKNGGGEVLIGGDYQGKGLVRNAVMTAVDENSTIYADALTMGDGGKVIVWADATAVFDGTIFARGGKEGGNGGFVETSGKINLGVTKGTVNTSAPKGQFGEWLMDPSSVNIITSGSASLATVANCLDITGTYTIAPATINAAMSPVTVCATGGAGTITVTNAVAMSVSGVSLTLTGS